MVKITKKILAMVIIASVCLTTVFSALITVNADGTDASYSITAEPVSAYADEGVASITFTLDSGFDSGSFTLLKNYIKFNAAEFSNLNKNDAGVEILPSLWNFEYSDVDIEVETATLKDGSAFNKSDITVDYTIKDTTDENGKAVDNKSPTNTYIKDETGAYVDNYGNKSNGNRCETDRLTDVTFSSTKTFTSVTLKITYKWDYHIRPNEKAPISIANNTQKDRDGKNYSNAVLKSGDVETVVTENNPSGNVNYFHTHKYDIDDQANYIYNNDYKICKGVCQFCGAEKQQLLTANASSGNVNTYYNISGVNVNYESNGTISLNIHCATFNGANEKLIVCYADGTKTRYGEISGSKATGSYYAKEKTENADGTVTYSDNLLPNGTMMYTISGLSTADIDKEFYLTRCITNANNKTYFGNTEKFSLMDYFTEVADGNETYYPAGTNAEQIAADQKVAVAFINYSVAAANALNNKVDSSVDNVLTWNGNISNGFSDTEHSGSNWDDAIIIANPQELAYLVTGAGGTTAGKYYKIADGITHFNMNGMSGITPDSTAADIQTAAANPVKNWRFGEGSGSNFTSSLWSNNFQGNFDGNGVVIYNLYTTGSQWSSWAGLFPAVRTNGDIEIKNVTVKASYFGATSTNATVCSGALVAHADDVSGSTGSLTLNANEVDNCVFTAKDYCGALVGYSANATAKVNDCLAVTNSQTMGGLAGGNGAYGSVAVKNSISIGTKASFNGTNVTFSNVYTNSTDTANGVTVLDDSAFKGNNAQTNISTLEWGAVWFNGKTGKYPTLSGTPYIDYWDGTLATSFASGTGTKADPYIIATAEQMAYLALSNTLDSNGKYFEVANNIKYFNMNGFDGITLNSTSADIANATANTNTKWIAKGSDATSNFCGNFNGNGVVIYNINAAKSSNAGLFPCVNIGGTTLDLSISNVTVKASYFAGYHYAGGIVGRVKDGRNAAINFSRCAVENCVIGNGKDTSTATNKISGAIAGFVDLCGAVVDNCLSQGNDFESGKVTGGLIGNSNVSYTGSKSIRISNTLTIGSKPISNVATGSTLGQRVSTATYVNVYTDQTTDLSGVKTVNNADLKGNAVQNTIPEFVWNKVWFTTTNYPTLTSDNATKLSADVETKLQNYGYTEFINTFATQYNRDTFTTTDNDCNLFATSLNLKSNPYISVTFAFQGDYRANKENVTAKFSVNGQSFDIKASEMTNNKTDTTTAGRYHLVRLKDIKVENLCDDISVELWYNGSKIGNGTISVAGFAFTAIDAGEGYEHYAAVAQAIVYYAECLQAKSAAYSK